MIKLEKIKLNNNVIECILFPEDSREGCILKYNVLTGDWECRLPDGYEYCKTHVAMACSYLRNNYKQGLPDEKLIMWY